ncbi:LysR family transcriptional regulator [Pseudomonas sp. NPDC090202]|uniref:LysR family transcriptional regulator n=1 Tax=unclassified Pseudomonas TaxID=196821 RepID=UPI003808899C
MSRYHEMLMFEALSEQPSLAAAASRLKVSRPTVVRAIARLEADFGVPLLHRSTKGIVLTSVGAAFMADCARIIKDVERAEASARGLHAEAQGNLTVLMPLLFSHYVMTPLMAGYMEAYPGVRVLAQYSDRFPNMHEEELDVAVVVGDLPNSSLIARPVGRVCPVVCGSPEYFLAHGVPEVPEDLHRHRLIATEGMRSKVSWDFLNQGELCNVRAPSTLSSSTVQGAIIAAANGAGLIRCLSYPLYECLKNERLQRVLQSFELPTLPVHVVYRERRRASMRVRSFVDFMVAGLRAHPAMCPHAL